MTNDCLINPARGRGEARIAGDVLFCVNPGEAEALGRYAKGLGWRRHFLYHSTLWCRPDGGAALCGPAIGAPMAVMTLEKMIVLGGQRFVVFGSCGALAPDLAVGDVLLPTWAVSQEGTSCHYPLASPPGVSMALHGELTAALAAQGFDSEAGGIWTTDAPYRERREVIRQYQAQGVAAVDMEFSALITVAAFRQVELAAVLIVSDLLSTDVWQPGFASRRYKSVTRAIGKALLDRLAARES